MKTSRGGRGGHPLTTVLLVAAVCAAAAICSSGSAAAGGNSKTHKEPAARRALSPSHLGPKAGPKAASEPAQRRAATIKGEGSAPAAPQASAKVQISSPTDMATAAAGHHGGGHHGGHMYMFTEVPKKGAYKMGFRRGNHKHLIERKESVHKSHVKSYFKWHDKKGKGSHKWDLNHYDKHSKKY